METFFTGLIMIGISLILISIIMVMLDRKRDSEEKREYIEIKSKLEELLIDSSEMVDELNRFSDYMVTRVDKKCKEYMDLINYKQEKKVDDTVAQQVSKVSEAEATAAAVTIKPSEPVPDIREINSVDEAVIFTEELEAGNSSGEDNSKGSNHKHNEVIKLFEAGMSDAEIAKALNIGKGEVQLIIGLNLHKIKV